MKPKRDHIPARGLEEGEEPRKMWREAQGGRARRSPRPPRSSRPRSPGRRPTRGRPGRASCARTARGRPRPRAGGPEREHPVDLRAVGGEDVEVDARVGLPEHAVLVPVGLADAQGVALGLERGHVVVLVRRVGHGEDDVDDRLCDEAGDRRRAGMLEQQGTRAERRSNPTRLALEPHGPRVVVVHEHDRAVVARPLVDRPRQSFRLISRGAPLPSAPARRGRAPPPSGPAARSGSRRRRRPR